MTIHTLQRPPDDLTTAARRQIQSLLAELDAARDEFAAVERERKTRDPDSPTDDLNARRDRAHERRDAALFALELGLGKHPNEAASSTLGELRRRFQADQRRDEPAEAPANAATVLPFVRPATRTTAEDDPWMTSKESAAHAKRLSPNGQVSSAWRHTLRQLEAIELASRQGGGHPNSQLLVKRSTVDKLIRGEITLGQET
jgi:hypothetical protein